MIVQDRFGFSKALLFGWIVVIALDLAALAGALQLRYDDGLQDAFSGDSASYRDYVRYAEQFTQSDGDIAVLFRGRDFADPEDLERISSFGLESQFLDNVSGSYSVFSLRGPPGEGGLSDPVLPGVLPPYADLASHLDGIAARDPALSRLLSADRNLTVVVVTLTDGGQDFAAARRTLAELRDLAQSHVEGREMTFDVTGLVALREAVVDDLYGDMWMLTAFGAVFGFVVCVFALRSLPLALLTVMQPATALLWALGALGALGYQIDVISVALPVLILVLSFADALHLSFEIRRLRQSGRAHSAIPIEAIRRVGPACVLASLTTALAFGGLTFSGSVLIREFGAAGMIGTIVSLLAVLFANTLLFATAVRFVGLDRLFAGQRGVPPRIFDWAALPLLALRRPAIVAAASVLVLLAAVGIYAGITTAYSYLENVDPDAPAFRALSLIEKELAPTGTIDVPVLLTENADGLDAESLRRIESVHAVVTAAIGEANIVSLANISQQLTDRDVVTRAERLNAYVDRMSDTQRARFVSADGQTGLVRLYVSDRGAAATRNLVSQLDAALAADPRAPLEFTASPTGFLVMAAFVSESMISDLNLCFLLAVCASGLLTVLWFRNLRYGLVALIPNILPIAAVGAWLALSGRGLQFASGIALTIAFGIAVDDTVHILNRLRLNSPPGRAFDPEAIRRSMAEVTPILVITTAVLSLGLIGTFFSDIPAVAYFGVLCIIVFFLAILADLFVLPPWLMCIHRVERITANRRRP